MCKWWSTVIRSAQKMMMAMHDYKIHLKRSDWNLTFRVGTLAWGSSFAWVWTWLLRDSGNRWLWASMCGRATLGIPRRDAPVRCRSRCRPDSPTRRTPVPHFRSKPRARSCSSRHYSSGACTMPVEMRRVLAADTRRSSSTTRPPRRMWLHCQCWSRACHHRRPPAHTDFVCIPAICSATPSAYFCTLCRPASGISSRTSWRAARTTLGFRSVSTASSGCRRPGVAPGRRPAPAVSRWCPCPLRSPIGSGCPFGFWSFLCRSGGQGGVADLWLSGMLPCRRNRSLGYPDLTSPTCGGSSWRFRRTPTRPCWRCVGTPPCWILRKNKYFVFKDN